MHKIILNDFLLVFQQQNPFFCTLLFNPPKKISFVFECSNYNKKKYP